MSNERLENLQDIIALLKKKARRCKSTALKQRYDAIRLRLKGYKRHQVAEILGISYYTVRRYDLLYNEVGIEGLTPKKSPGRPRVFTVEQEHLLYDCIKDKLPKEVGFEPFANWTAPLACKWVLKNFGVQLSERGMRNVFVRIGLSYTRPTYTLKKADPEKQEAFKKTLKF